MLSCPSATYTITDSSNLTSCYKCPTYCSSCLSNSTCTVCESGAFFYLQLCYSSCPVVAPYSYNNVCQSCNVADCQTCVGTQCTVCIGGKYLIGTELCISGCSNNQVYNSANRSCDTISPSGGGTTTTTINSLADINFIPLPYLIVLVICSVLVGALHFRGKVAAVPILYGLAGGLLILSNLTIIIVAAMSSTLNTVLSMTGFYCLIVGQTLVLICSVVSLILWYSKLNG